MITHCNKFLLSHFIRLQCLLMFLCPSRFGERKKKSVRAATQNIKPPTHQHPPTPHSLRSAPSLINYILSPKMKYGAEGGLRVKNAGE